MLQLEDVVIHPQLSTLIIALATCLLGSFQVSCPIGDIGSMWHLISEVKQPWAWSVLGWVNV